MFTQSLRHSKAVPPPFAQGRLMKEVETYSKLSPSGKGDCREVPQKLKAPLCKGSSRGAGEGL